MQKLRSGRRMNGVRAVCMAIACLALAWRSAATEAVTFELADMDTGFYAGPMAFGDDDVYLGSVGTLDGEVILGGGGLKLYGSATFTGEQYTDMEAQAYVFGWAAQTPGVFQAGDTIQADYEFEIDASGGRFQWELHSHLYYFGPLFLEEVLAMGQSPELMPLPSDEPMAFAGTLMSVPAPYDLAPILSVTTLAVVWDDFSSTDTMTITIPDQSIDISVASPSAPAPEPGTLALLGVSAISGLARRRRPSVS